MVFQAPKIYFQEVRTMEFATLQSPKSIFFKKWTVISVPRILYTVCSL